MSLPSRERGLKSIAYYTAMKPPSVAPFAGAWIEIEKWNNIKSGAKASLPSRERGLKYYWRWLNG